MRLDEGASASLQWKPRIHANAESFSSAYRIVTWSAATSIFFGALIGWFLVKPASPEQKPQSQ
jgi:hypothetical protein